MRKFKISDTHSVPKENISNIIKEHFGKISSMEDDSYIIENPKHPILEEIYININYENNELILDIHEKDLSYVISNNLSDEVTTTISSKNKFLKEVTGYTVADRKQEWRQDVLPTNESIIRYN